MQQNFIFNSSSLNNFTNSSFNVNEGELPSFRHWIYLTNLFIYAFEFPISLYSAFIIISSAILHPNLKLVLICQNACFFIFAFSRTLQISITYAINPNAWQSYKSIQCAFLFSVLYGNIIGHVLLVERLLATKFVKDYEHKQKLWFSICWFPLLFTISLTNSYFETYQSNAPNASLNITIGTIVSLFISLAMSFVEIFLLSMMGVYNQKAYHEQKGGTLAERYQMSENIRTSRQLGPTFLFHFANICCTTLLGTCMYFGLVFGDVFTFMAITFWCNSLFNTIIEISVIIRHPILRRNAKDNLAKLIPSFCFSPIPHLGGGKVHAASSCATMENDTKKWTKEGRNGPRNIDGQKLIQNLGQEDHFCFLANSWKLGAKSNNGEPERGGVGSKSV